MIVFQSIRFIYLSDDLIYIDLHRGIWKLTNLKHIEYKTLNIFIPAYHILRAIFVCFQVEVRNKFYLKVAFYMFQMGECLISGKDNAYWSVRKSFQYHQSSRTYHVHFEAPQWPFNAWNVLANMLHIWDAK